MADTAVADPAPPPRNVAAEASNAGAPAPAPMIDREKVCPLLIRAFPKVGGHHRIQEYQRRGSEPEGEMHMYTWPDATLRELCDLVKDVQVAARERNAKLYFSFVYPDKRGKLVMREVGVVHATRRGSDDDKTLKQLMFETGDFLDIAIVVP